MIEFGREAAYFAHAWNDLHTASGRCGDSDGGYRQ